MTKSFLQLNIVCNILNRNMSRSFHHDLHTEFPGTLNKFSKGNQFLDLPRSVASARQPRPQAVTKAKDQLML